LVCGWGRERIWGVAGEVAFTGFLWGSFTHADVVRGATDRVGEEPVAGGGGETDAVGYGGEPEFEGGAVGVGEGDPDIELMGSEYSGDFEEGRVWGESEDFVDGGVVFPE
jgi:hypothetical protein